MVKETDLIKQKLDVADVLRSYIHLTPAGRNFKALCPFHPEKTPSFIVSPDRQSWHCFGCGEGGDVIKFVMKYESLEFPEALRFLGEKAGIPIRTFNSAQEREFGVLYDLYDAAREFYKEELKKREKALAYLTQRGLLPATIEEFDVGYAPGGEALVVALLRKKFDMPDIVRAGLAFKNVHGLHRDRFQGRIVFPIFNPVGKTVAFTGRIFEVPSGMKEEDLPKYLNSPESPIFNKSKILFGLQKTKVDIARERAAMIVEGQMDFLMTWQAGIRNVVALSGTGLTVHHLERLRRIADTVVLSFDNDAAGLKALERGLDLFGPFDFYVKAIRLDGYKDPADAVKADPAILTKVYQEAKPAFQYIFERHFGAGAPDLDMAAKKRVVRDLLMRIKRVQSAMEQDTWVKELARYSAISETALRAEWVALPAIKTAEDAPAQSTPVPEPQGERIDRIAQRIVTLAYANTTFLEQARELKDSLPPFYRAAVEDTTSQVATAAQMQAAYVVNLDNMGALQKEFADLTKQLKIEMLRKSQLSMQEAIRRAQLKGDDDETMRVMEEFRALSQKIDELQSDL